MEPRTCGAVASPHAAATSEAVRVLRSGGNAVDAAVAACAVLTVVYPHMCTIGGDMFALVRRPSGEIVGLNGSGAAPMNVQPDDLRSRYGTSMPVDGPDTVTVPGVVDAWATLAEKEGSLPLAGLIETAAQLADEGCEVSPSLARAISAGETTLREDTGMALVFFSRGAPLGVGDALLQPALGRTLRRIAQDGPREFYSGDLGKAYVDLLRRRGSRLTLEDMASHATEQVPPLSRRFRQWEVSTTPPNSQGFGLLEILAAVDHLGLDLDPLGPDVSVLAHIYRGAAEDRDRFLADPRRGRVPVDDLLNDEHIAALAQSALQSVREAGASGMTQRVDDRHSGLSGDTIAVVALDEAGGAASIIQSIFHSFGSGIMDPVTGVIAQNRGACFSLDPASPNALAGGRRSLHTLMPVMVEKMGELAVVAGTMGGRAQPQVHAQVLGRLFQGHSPADAVAAPRWVVGSLDAGGPKDVIFAEPTAIEECGDRLEATGMPVHLLGELDEDVGHAQYISVCEDGHLLAAADPRSDGTAEVVLSDA